MIFFHRNTKMKTQYTKMNNDRVTIDCKQLLIVAAEGPVWANHPLSCDDADGLFGVRTFKSSKVKPRRGEDLHENPPCELEVIVDNSQNLPIFAILIHKRNRQSQIKSLTAV